jgi:hypothetical protein
MRESYFSKVRVFKVDRIVKFDLPLNLTHI